MDSGLALRLGRNFYWLRGHARHRSGDDVMKNILPKHPPCVFSTALAGSGFFDASSRYRVVAETKSELTAREGASKKFRMRNELKNPLMTALRGLGLFLISCSSHAFTCAVILPNKSVDVISTNSLTCAAGQVAFLEAADLTSWQTLLANAVLVSQPFDYVLAGAFWAFAFSFTVGIWFFTKNISLIFQAIKNW